MKNAPKSTLALIRQEQLWGFAYLLVELLALPAALRNLNALLPAPLSESWLNFLYFSINFLFVLTIFHNTLQQSLLQAGKHKGRFLRIALAGFCLYLLCNLVVGMLLRLLAPDYANLNDGQIQLQLDSNYLIMAISAVILAPVAEELLHRGLVFGSLYAVNPVAAYVISAAFFSLIHILGYIGLYTPLHLLIAFVQYLPAGFVLAWAYKKSGSIFCPIVIHAAVNTLALFSLR